MDHKEFERKEFGSYYTTDEGILEWTERVLELLPEAIKEIEKRLKALEKKKNV